MTEPPKGQRSRSPRPGESIAGTPPLGSRDPRPDSAPVPEPQPPLAPPGDAALPQPPPAEDDVLVLPVGALVAMRRSGGLLFTVREVVIYPDGRLATNTVGGGAGHARGTRVLDAAHMATLRHILGGIDFALLHAAPQGHPHPDGYAYEIAVRPGGTPPLEVFAGTIPPALAPLLKLLNDLCADEN